MSKFNWKENIEDSIKVGLIITPPPPPPPFTGIFFMLKAANVKPPKVPLDAMDIMKFGGRICRGVLVKSYAVYKKWINE